MTKDEIWAELNKIDDECKVCQVFNMESSCINCTKPQKELNLLVALEAIDEIESE